MPQANDANIVRVFTRSFGGTIEELAPNVTGGTHQFEVIVEAEAGSVRAGNGSPYTITLTACDLTACNSATNISAKFNPANLATPLNQSFQTAAAALPPDGGLGAAVSNNITTWPGYEQKFVITLTAAEAANAAGHVFQYTAVLQAKGTDPIVSITQSAPFILV